jgi:hypothetical protein
MRGIWFLYSFFTIIQSKKAQHQNRQSTCEFYFQNWSNFGNYNQSKQPFAKVCTTDNHSAMDLKADIPWDELGKTHLKEHLKGF